MLVVLYIAYFFWEEQNLLRTKPEELPLTTVKYHERIQSLEDQSETKVEGNRNKRKEENFSADVLLINSIIKKKVFCKQWIEIGTGDGIETLWLRMTLEQHKQLISYDSVQHHGSTNSALERQVEGEILYLQDFEMMIHDNITVGSEKEERCRDGAPAWT